MLLILYVYIELYKQTQENYYLFKSVKATKFKNRKKKLFFDLPDVIDKSMLTEV